MQNMPLSLRSVVRKAREKHFPRGQILLYQDDVPSEAFIIKTGVLKVYDIDDHGNEKILHILKTPALVPLAFFSPEEVPVKWFYAALTDCDVYVMPVETLKQAMSADSSLAMALINTFWTDVHELLVRLASLEKTNARGKMTAVLKFLVTCHAAMRRSGWWRVNFSVNHQLLADLSGITRESAAMVMKELSDEKIVRNPRLTILEINRDKLVKL